MRRAMTTLLVLMLIPMAAHAQRSERGSAQGSIFFGPGGVSGGATTATVHFGGDAEVLVYKGLGAGAEIGYLTPWQSFSYLLFTSSQCEQLHAGLARRAKHQISWPKPRSHNTALQNHDQTAWLAQRCVYPAHPPS